jgi:hypothetical protein
MNNSSPRPSDSREAISSSKLANTQNKNKDVITINEKVNLTK